MAGVKDGDTVDLVAQDPNDGPYVLVIVEEQPWVGDSVQVEQYKHKLNGYAGFIMDGGLGVTYPETIGQPVRVELVCASAPEGLLEEAISYGARRLREDGIEFTMVVNPELQPKEAH